MRGAEVNRQVEILAENHQAEGLLVKVTGGPPEGMGPEGGAPGRSPVRPPEDISTEGGARCDVRGSCTACRGSSP
jgi:hypothetical protein